MARSSTPPALDVAFVRAQRLRAQQLSRPEHSSPEALLEWMVALQAQDRPASLWALGARLPGSTLASLEAAVAARQLVRTWVPRGTLHWVASKDLRGLLSLLGPRVSQRLQPRLRQLGVTAAQLAASQATLARALTGRRVVSRPDALALIAEAGVPVDGQRGYHLLAQAALAGVVAWGPMVGKQPGLVGLDGWVPDATPSDRDAALTDLARRYWQSRGPASLKDFVWWSGLTSADAKAALAALRPELASGNFAGETLYWFETRKTSPAGGTLLLPAFDEWLIAYQSRDVVMAPEHKNLVVPGANGLFHPILVIDGEVRGTWQRPGGASKPATPRPFAPLSRAEQATLGPAIERLHAFLGREG